jgi:hypothetical protein
MDVNVLYGGKFIHVMRLIFDGDISFTTLDKLQRLVVNFHFSIRVCSLLKAKDSHNCVVGQNFILR